MYVEFFVNVDHVIVLTLCEFVILETNSLITLCY